MKPHVRVLFGKLLALFETSEVVGIDPFRQATGVSRNLAVALLEFFDPECIAKHQGNGRMLVKK